LADEQLTPVTGGGYDLTSPGNVVWTLTDQQNTVRDLATYNALTGQTTVVNHLVYSSFGQILSQTNPATGDPATVTCLFAYAGRPTDTPTGLENDRARIYDAALMRFISEDPTYLTAGDTNLERYCGNDPVNLVDPSGLKVYREAKVTFQGPFIAHYEYTVRYFYAPDDATAARLAVADRGELTPLSLKQQKLVSFAQGDIESEEALAAIFDVLAANISFMLPHIANYLSSVVGWIPFPEEEYPTVTGFCGAWVDFNFPSMPKSTANLRIVKADFDVANTYLGHNAIRLEFGNAQGITNVAYLDNGWKGGADHIFFPSDIPPGTLGNEHPQILLDGKPAPFAAPIPPPPPLPPAKFYPYGWGRLPGPL